jgi:hypothetical protein
VVKKTGKHVAYVRTTEREKSELTAVLDGIAETHGYKVTETELIRIAICSLLADYAEKGSDSLLMRVVTDLKDWALCKQLMPDTSEPYEFAGFLSPNTTPVPDVLFDELLQQLDNAELRVLLYIIRRTYGFKKSSDDISIGQMVDGITRKDGTVLDGGTGMAKSSVTRALSGLLAKKIIIARRNQSRERGNEPTTYALRLKTDEKVPLVPNAGQAPLVPPVDQPLSHGRDTQKTVIQ